MLKDYPEICFKVGVFCLSGELIMNLNCIYCHKNITGLSFSMKIREKLGAKKSKHN